MYKIDSNFNINKISPNLSITDIDNNKKYDKIFIITEKRINDLFSKHKIFDLGFHQISINDSKDIKTLHSVKLIINDDNLRKKYKKISVDQYLWHIDHIFHDIKKIGLGATHFCDIY